MFTRRNTRSSHGTAYTGVSRTTAANANQQLPNSGALAAALSIGNALKQQNTSGAAKKQHQHQQSPSNIPRSSSFQYKPASANSLQKPQQPHTNSISSTGSLLKRGSRSSIQTSNQQQPSSTSQQLHAPRTFSASSRGSSTSSRHNSPLTSSDSVPHPHHTQVYDIDDSFNDSYLDEITEETTQTYLRNKANMKDLRLPKQARNNTTSTTTTTTYKKAAATPKKSPMSPTSPQLNSFSGPVKMVKKYVPSPTGIKIIEVPEAQFQKEVARSNSMRSNSLVSRSNSLRNMSLNRRSNIPRSSSMTGVSRQVKQTPNKATTGTRSASSPLKSMHEEVALEEKLGHSDDLHEQELKYRALEKEIEEEKKLAAQIELKRKEYEQLKKTRLENEQKLKDLEDLYGHNNSITTESTVIHNPVQDTEYHGVVEEEEESEEDVPIVKVPPAVDELEKKNREAVQVADAVDGEVSSNYSDAESDLPEEATGETPVEEHLPVEHAEKFEDDARVATHDVARDATNEESVTVSVPIHEEHDVEKISKPVLSSFDETTTADTTTEDLTIEQDKDETLSPAGIAKDGYTSVSDDDREYSSVDPGLASEIGVINQYHNLNSSELLHNTESVSFEEIHGDGIEEVADSDYEGEEHGKSNLAKELRPKFETTPEIIEPTEPVEELKDEEENSKPESEDTLLPPAISTASSSKSSVSSVESPQKKPIKSAMKSTSSFSTPAQGSQQPPINSALAKSNAAQQAYLSLTTAENTRLNSKLSNSNIAPNPDFALSTNGPSGAYPQFASPQFAAHNNINNQPNRRLSQQTLRKPQQGQRNGLQGSQRPFSTQQQMPTSMSSRSLRPNSFVQPIQPHPALQPGYQSPSKAKAAALYAKAQARPVSQFKPPANRSSSYTREENLQQQQQQQLGQPQQGQQVQVQPPPPNGAALDAEVPPRSPNRAEPKRTTLRSAPLAQATPQHQQQQPVYQEANGNGNGNGKYQQASQKGPQVAPFQSRFNDSDDDISGGFGAGVSRNNFKSRFNDSDEDIASVPVTSLRDQRDAGSPKKEKKFKKLRKLFGSSKN
ncbi:hypothetical protein Cantr_05909 [Candida viswanathii]|uniref:Uncharacterized protein n=1 Tax=Candida viswanathii TaxID=5486 RepID=A0A367XRG4_9ASCO|nr:hypothetical protein Cantr_05909 [Candida viswanathii]